jgi:hypothetical protein
MKDDTRESFKSLADTPNVSYWTSGAHVSSGWTWTGDGHQTTYTNWATDEPTETDFNTQACVYLYDGYMYDRPCKDRLQHFICEKNCPTQSSYIKNIDTNKDLVNLGGRNYYFSPFYVSTLPLLLRKN